MNLPRIGSLLIASITVITGIVALLSVWGVIDVYVWWQALLSLSIILVTGWMAIAAFRYAQGQQVGWMSYEATMVIVSILFMMVIASAGAGTTVDGYSNTYDDLGGAAL